MPEHSGIRAELLTFKGDDVEEVDVGVFTAAALGGGGEENTSCTALGARRKRVS